MFEVIITIKTFGIPLLVKFYVVFEKMEIRTIGMLLLCTNQVALLVMCLRGFLPCIRCF